MFVADVAEQSRKLAFMRGENHLRFLRRLDRFEQTIRRLRQSSSAHPHPAPVRAFADNAVRTKSRVRCPTPAPGPITQALRRLSLNSSANSIAVSIGANHHRGQRGGVDRERIPRRGQRDEASPGAQARRAPTSVPRRLPRHRPRPRWRGLARIYGRRSAAPETTCARLAGRFRKSAAESPRARAHRSRYRRRARDRNASVRAAANARACGGRKSRFRWRGPPRP